MGGFLGLAALFLVGVGEGLGWRYFSGLAAFFAE